MADSRIRQHAFHVPLKNSGIGAQHQREKTRAADNPEPGIGAGQHGPESHQQKHPRLDHCGRVQVNRYGRRRRHGVGQPEMKRKLCTLGQRSQRDQDQRWQIPGMHANPITRSQHHIHVVTADNAPQEQHAREQAQTAGGGDRQRHAGAPARVKTVIPVTNEHERRQAGQFPEHHQLNQVAREHHPKHGAHESQQE